MSSASLGRRLDACARTAPDDAFGAGATIVPYPDGPLIVRGDFELQQPDGTPIEYHGAAVALCRCGRSATKPLCDGSHKLARPSVPQPRSSPGAP